MNGSSQQQAYDRGITIFSPDGRLYQVEYAREAVKRGTATVGVRTEDGVVLAADRRTRSPLVEASSVEKLHAVDDHLGIASAGHVADARQLVDLARRRAQTEWLRYDQPVGVESLTKEITDHIQQYTQTGGARPFGVALLVAGIEDGEPRLFETDPSGTPYEWSAVAVGGGRDEIQEHLEEHYDDSLSIGDGVELAVEALAVPREDDFEAGGVEIATADVDSESFETKSPTEVDELVADLDLAEGGDEE